MARRSLLYFLFSDNNKPLYQDKTGVILEADSNWKKPDGNPAHLVHEPAGFKESVWKYARNPAVWGVFRDFSESISFVEDGRQILKHLVWTYGTEVNCRLGILKLDRIQLPYNYQTIYLSELNFSKYDEFETNIKCETLEGGPSKYWKANESTKYTIDVDNNPNHVRLYNDGMAVENKGEFAVSDGIPDPTNPNYYLKSHYVDISLVQKEVQDIGGIFSIKRSLFTNGTGSEVHSEGKSFFKATEKSTVHFEWDFKLQVTITSGNVLNPTSALRVHIRKIGKADNYLNFVNPPLQLLTITDPFFIPGSHHIQGAADFALEEGDELYFVTFVTPVGGADGDVICAFNYGGEIPFLKMAYTFREDPSYISCLTPIELAKKLVAKMSNGTCDVANTSFINNLGILYSPADAIRSLPNSQIVISWKDFYQSLKQFCPMMSFSGNYFVLDNFSNAFQQGTALKLGEVSKAELKYAEELVCNSIKAGFPNKNYTETNGRYEFNQGQSWGLPITRVSRELDISSQVRADAFGAEVLRSKFQGKTTTDSENDNDTFMFSAIKTADQDNYTLEELLIHNDASGDFNMPFVSKHQGQNFTPNTTFDQFTYSATYKQQVRIDTAIQLVKDPDHSDVRVTIYRNNDIIQQITFAANGNSQNLSVPLFTIEPNDVIRINVLSINGQNEILVISCKTVITFTAAYIYKLNRPAYSSITGVGSSNTVYNVPLRPHNAILNNGSLIHSIIDRFSDNKFVEFNSGDRNVNLSTTFNGVVVNENENIPIKALNPILFLPWYIIFTTEIPVDLFTIIKMNPYQRIEFQWKGKTYRGFLWDGGVRVSTEDSQQWTLIAAPESDLKNFNS